MFLIAGVIRPEKGQIEAVRALAQLRKEHPQVRLIIAGDGETEELLRVVRSLGVSDRVDITGFVAEIGPIY